MSVPVASWQYNAAGQLVGYDGYGRAVAVSGPGVPTPQGTGAPPAPVPSQMMVPFGVTVPPGYGVAPGSEPPPPGPDARAVLAPPNVHEMTRKGAYRMAFFPTAPFYSMDPDVGYQTRYYSNGILNQAAGTEQVVNVLFDLPCRLVAINGSCIDTTGAGFPIGHDQLDFFLFRLEYSQGDRLHVSERLGSTVVGSSKRPGEIGGAGWTIDGGATVRLGITPLRANLRVDITLACLEMRGPRNFK